MSPLPLPLEKHPPTPCPVFRVGVTGHLPKRLTKVTPELLQRRIHEVLSAVRAGVQGSKDPVQCVLVTSLAEGTDRIAAHVAKSLEFRLHVPLPMPVEPYIKEFKGGRTSVVEFEKLLESADRKLTLPAAAEGTDLTPCYVAASNVVLHQSDLLLVVSDGEGSGGAGGADDTSQLAVERGIPMVIIAATPAAEVRFPGHGEALSDPIRAVEQAIRSILSPLDKAHKQLKDYKEETWPRRFPFAAYAALRLAGEKRVKLPRRPSELLNEPSLQDPHLRRYFLWSDALALLYGERSRSASLWLQMLATLSVIAALLNMVLGGRKEINVPHGYFVSFVLTELMSLALLLLFAGRSHMGCWHERWLRYRSLAEQLRCVDLLAPLGLSTIVMQPPAEDSVPWSERWSTVSLGPWLVQRIEAEGGLNDATMDEVFFEERLAHLHKVLEDQEAFHEAATDRYKAAEKTFHHLGILLFSLAVLFTIADVAMVFSLRFSMWIHGHAWLDMGASLSAAALPAVGAAAAAIAAQGEYKRLAERSRQMQHSLKQTARLAREATAPLTLASISRLSLAASHALSGEVRDWTVLLAIRGPSVG